MASQSAIRWRAAPAGANQCESAKAEFTDGESDGTNQCGPQSASKVGLRREFEFNGKNDPLLDVHHLAVRRVVAHGVGERAIRARRGTELQRLHVAGRSG